MVVAAFRKRGPAVTVEAAGSRTMACDSDPRSYDFAFPGSVPAAAEVLAKAMPPGVVSADLQTFNFDKYLNQVVRAKKRWRDLRLPAPYPLFQRAVLLSTRLDTSNSAELYLAPASYAANGDAPIPSADPGAVTDQAEELFRSAGSTALTSEEPFDQYFSAEGYQLPMQVVHEAQFLDAACSWCGTPTPARPAATGTRGPGRRRVTLRTECRGRGRPCGPSRPRTGRTAPARRPRSAAPRPAW
ncbi:hypothetical protein [Actinoplanes subtropicus]|uniref:hypothetical protein n=1 Tax=Actinoplanes subtropicus TaxID=543632 RepID=UPI0004C3A709|nr:hypothetical protein [Actinoplanes subtropicus]